MQFEAKLDKYLKAISTFRDDIRKMARENATSKDILALCDRFRDQELVNLGVQLDDGQGADGAALYKLVDPATLIRQREERQAIAAEKEAKKAAAKLAADKKARALLEKGRTSPTEMFKPPHVAEGVWQAWDDRGIPTLDAEGQEVSKSARKKIEKEWKVQEGLHDKWLQWKENESS
jgi:cysteinyl-tRNA synthetase